MSDSEKLPEQAVELSAAKSRLGHNRLLHYGLIAALILLAVQLLPNSTTQTVDSPAADVEPRESPPDGIPSREYDQHADVLEGKRGFIRRVYHDPVLGDRRYLLFLPADFEPGDRHPVVMFLNGGGEKGEGGTFQVAWNFGYDVWARRDVFPFVAVMCQLRKGGSWRAPGHDVDMAMGILEEVEREYDTDPERVYLTGVSSGGVGVWSIAATHPERFAAIAPCAAASGGMGVDELASRIAAANVPVWSFYNDGDEDNYVRFNREIRDALVREGRSPLFAEYHYLWHNAWYQMYSTGALYSWLLDQSRSQNENYDRRFELLDPADVADSWFRIGSDVWDAEGEELIAGGGKSGSISGASALVAPQPLDAHEVHLDARWDREKDALRIGLVRLSEEGASQQLSEGLILVLPGPEAGIGALTTLEGKMLARLDPFVQWKIHQYGWNDVRIRVDEGNFTVTINGWEAFNYGDDAGLLSDAHLALFAPESSETEGRWRFIRTRPVKSPNIAANAADEP